MRFLRDGGGDNECVHVWSSESTDVAALEVLGAPISPAFEYRLCELRHHGEISNITVTGFPLLAIDAEDGHSQTSRSTGSMRLESNDGTLSFASNIADVPWLQDRWRGMSGAGVYATGPGRSRDLYGVVTYANKKFQFGKLYISSLKDSDVQALRNVGRRISPSKPPLESAVMSDDLAERAIKKFGLNALYKLRPSSPSVTTRMAVFCFMPCCRRNPSKKLSVQPGFEETKTKRAPSFPSLSTRPAVTWNWRATKVSRCFTYVSSMPTTKDLAVWAPDELTVRRIESLGLEFPT